MGLFALITVAIALGNIVAEFAIGFIRNWAMQKNGK